MKSLFPICLTLAFVSMKLFAMDVGDTYAQYCASCHGGQLQGGLGPSLVDEQWNNGESEADIARVIGTGSLDKGMPAWEKVLSEKDIRGLVIFIQEKKASAQRQSIIHKASAIEGVFRSAAHKFRMEELARTNGLLWSIDFLAEDRLLVSERDGKLYVVEGGKFQAIQGTPKVWANGQGGLLEVQKHPDFHLNAWIYLSFSDRAGGLDDGQPAGMTRVVRGKIKDDKWTEQEDIFSVDPSLHSSAGVHFGSRFVFSKGYLFFGIGDRGRQQYAQDLSRPNGKIFRIFDNGNIPRDNPFVQVPGAIKSIWSYGHRNPQGLDMDSSTGALWETEHGPRGGDEINLIEKGKNYGWPEITYGMNYDGTPITGETHRAGMEQPKRYWVPSIAVSGIDFYDADLFSNWKGKLLVGSLAAEELHLISIEAGRVVGDEILLKNQGRIRDVGVAPSGKIILILNTQNPPLARIVSLEPVQ